MPPISPPTNPNDPLTEAERQLWPTLPSVSVIVLNYNTREHLDACFHSLQHLLYPADRLELILVDNASTDGSAEYMRTNFAEVKIISNEQNYGFSQGNNIGAANAQGDWVAFLNPDMRVDPRWLIELVKPLLTAPDIAAVGSQILSWDGQTIDFAGGAANFYGYGYQIGLGQIAAATPNPVKPILFACGGAMLVRRQLFLEVGGFDEDFFAYYEDLDLGWRLWVLGYQVMLAPAALTYHIHHGAWGKVSKEKRRVLYERNALLTILKNYNEENLNKILPAALLLLLKRIHLACGIDDTLFRMGPKPQGNPPAAIVSAPTAHPTYGPAHYFKETWRTLRRQGLYTLYLKIKTELKTRVQARARSQKPGQMHWDNTTPQQAVIPLQALSYVVAGNDVTALYDKMLTKRAFIQARRQRADQEIFRLFKRPLGFSELWPEYQQAQTHLVNLLGIDQVFEPKV